MSRRRFHLMGVCTKIHRVGGFKGISVKIRLSILFGVKLSFFDKFGYFSKISNEKLGFESFLWFSKKFPGTSSRSFRRQVL